jgi:hypothetical protein
MCSDIKPPKPFTCGDVQPRATVLQVKSSVYEKVNGKRKRVSPFVMSEDGKTVIEIKQRAIVGIV